MEPTAPPPAGDGPDQHLAAPAPDHPSVLATLRTGERRVQLAVLHLLGLDPDDRERVLAGMLRPPRREGAGYWLQLLLSMAIATLGLALGSTAVVIGAMLVSPLMAPLLELGMGLVVGSPALTLRALVRSAGSVAAVVGGSALLTLLLPFHEVNPEIASRTSPTLLDLLIATCVALVAAFTTVRSSSDTASAAAGTAIGIALVPPLCVIGFGIGTGDWPVAEGATLLFTANLSAILGVAVLSFLALGFDAVDLSAGGSAAADMEAGADAAARPGRAFRALAAVLGSRAGRVVRIGVPLLLLGGVMLPLYRALDQVSREVRTRKAISDILDGEPLARNAVRSVLSVTGGTVTLRLFVIASPQRAAELKRTLHERIARVTPEAPTLDVVAVPDADALRAVAAQAHADEVAPAVPAQTWSELAAAIRDVWPAEAGPLVHWSVSADSTGATLHAAYLGQPLGPAAEALLSRSLSDQIGSPVRVSATAFPAAPVTAPADGDPNAWLTAFVHAADLARRSPAVHLCVATPEAAAEGTLALVRGEVAALPPGRATLARGDAWSFRLSPAPCAPPTPPDSTADARLGA